MSPTVQAVKVENGEIPQKKERAKPPELTDLAFRIERVPLVIKELLKVENVRILLINPDGSWMHREGGITVIEERNEQKIYDYTLVANEVVNIVDAVADSRVLNGTIKNSLPGMRSFIGHPLVTKGGSHVGVLCVWGSQPRSFTPEELELFEDARYWIQRYILSSRELERATDIQQSFQPESDLQIQGYEIAGFCQPHYSVGGDFYDWFASSHGAVFTIGDVMGKGIGAAIMAASVRTALRTTSWDHGVQEGMKIASQVLELDLHKAGAFVTLVYGQLDRRSHQVQYVDAGHGLTMHITKNGEITRMESANFPIGTGLVEEWDVHTVEMAHGDTLIMLSDGFLDMVDGSMERLTGLGGIVPARKSALEIIDDLRELVRDSITLDDVTALVLRRN